MVSILKWFLLICSYKISINTSILTIYNTILPYFELKESFDYKPTTYSLFDDEASFISTNSFIHNFFNNANPNVRFTFLRVNRTAPKIYYYLFSLKNANHIAHKKKTIKILSLAWTALNQYKKSLKVFSVKRKIILFIIAVRFAFKMKMET